MTITPSLFEAHLKCPTKCWLRSNREPAAGNAYAEWVQTQNESYRAEAADRLMADAPADQCAVAPAAENLKAAKWRLATDVDIVAQASPPASSGSVSLPERTSGKTPCELADGTSALQCRLHAVERIPSECRGKAAQFIPIRFIFRNKLTKDDKLLLAFDGFALSEALGREIAVGKIIHGDDHFTPPSNRSCARESAADFPDQATGRQAEAITAALSRAQLRAKVANVKTSALAGEVRKRLEKIAALRSSPAPPDLVLNRHCAECEFQSRCREARVLSKSATLKRCKQRDHESACSLPRGASLMTFNTSPSVLISITKGRKYLFERIRISRPSADIENAGVRALLQTKSSTRMSNAVHTAEAKGSNRVES